MTDKKIGCVQHDCQECKTRAAIERQSVPAGYVLVPIEPSDEMIDATYAGQHCSDIWRDMVAAAQPLSDDKLEQIEAAVKELTETLEDLADYAGAFSVSGVYLVEDKHARALLAQAYKLVLKYDN